MKECGNPHKFIETKVIDGITYYVYMQVEMDEDESFFIEAMQNSCVDAIEMSTASKPFGARSTEIDVWYTALMNWI